MRSFTLAIAMVLLAGSTALGGWVYGAPVVVGAPVVHSYRPIGPVYAYPPAPVMVRRPVVLPAPVIYLRPVVVPAPVIHPRPVVVRSPVWVAPPVVVRPKIYVRGQPVRNAIRAALP